MLTNDVWKRAVNLDFSFYEDADTNLRNDIQECRRSEVQFTSVNELRHAESLLTWKKIPVSVKKKKIYLE
jgi:hypothetical protein